MNLLGVLGIISAIIALIAAGTAVVAFTRASYAKATIEALRGDVGDRDKRIEFLEDENDRTKAALKRMGDENTFMKDLVTNRAELKEFIAIAKEHEDKADERHHEQIAMDEQILITVQGLHDQIGVKGK